MGRARRGVLTVTRQVLAGECWALAGGLAGLRGGDGMRGAAGKERRTRRRGGNSERRA
jgi:hypothetical protein